MADDWNLSTRNGDDVRVTAKLDADHRPAASLYLGSRTWGLYTAVSVSLSRHEAEALADALLKAVSDDAPSAPGTGEEKA